MKKRLITAMIPLLLVPAGNVWGWTDQTHMAIGMAAGFSGFHNCPAADVSKTVAVMNGLEESDVQGHFFNADPDAEISRETVYAQLSDIGKSREECPQGYLLGAVLNAARLCRERTASGAYDDEYYAVLLHYTADLSQPLHVSTFDDFNSAHHFACDDLLSDREGEYPVLAAMDLADELSVWDELIIENEDDIADAVITLANQSRELAGILREEDRDMTREEALLQVSRSAELARALMRYCGKIE